MYINNATSRWSFAVYYALTARGKVKVYSSNFPLDICWRVRAFRRGNLEMPGPHGYKCFSQNFIKDTTPSCYRAQLGSTLYIWYTDALAISANSFVKGAAKCALHFSRTDNPLCYYVTQLRTIRDRESRLCLDEPMQEELKNGAKHISITRLLMLIVSVPCIHLHDKKSYLRTCDDYV